MKERATFNIVLRNRFGNKTAQIEREIDDVWSFAEIAVADEDYEYLRQMGASVEGEVV